MSRLIVYTAGPIRGTSYKECTSWRDYAEQELADFEVLSPMRHKVYLEKEHRITDHYDKLLSTPDAIFCHDRWDVKRCNILLVNLAHATSVSIGTVMEIAWANAWDKPIVVVMDEPNIHTHAMLNKAANFIVGDLDTAIEIIRGFK